MTRRCTVCGHPDREAIDKALVAGASFRDIAGQYKLSKSAVERHKAEHLPAAMAKAKEAADVAHGDDLLEQVRKLQNVTMSILAKAYNANDLRIALQAIAQARGNLELLGRLLGELQAEGTVNVLISPEWVQVRTVILSALSPYPAARVAVAGELGRLDHGQHDK
jgi:hypothetical protein